MSRKIVLTPAKKLDPSQTRNLLINQIIKYHVRLVHLKSVLGIPTLFAGESFPARLDLD